VEHQQPSEAEPVTVPAGTDICGAAAAHTVIVTTSDDSGQPTPVRPGVIRTGAYVGTLLACRDHVNQAAWALRGAGHVVDVITPATPPRALCGEVWRVAADSVLTEAGGPAHLALLAAAAGTARAAASTPVVATAVRHGVAAARSGGVGGCAARCDCGVKVEGFDTMAGAIEQLEQHIADEAAVDQPQDTPAVDTAVVQTCGRPAAAGLSTQPQALRWPTTSPYAGTIWVCAGHEDVVVDRARDGGLDVTLVGAPARVECGDICSDGVNLIDLPAGAWPRLAVVAAANATTTDPTQTPDRLRVRAEDLRPGMWVATGDPAVPGIEVRAVEIGDTGLVGVLCAGPEYSEASVGDLVDLVDAETVAAAAEALRVRTRRQLMLDGLSALVAAAYRDPSILPVDRLQVTGRAADLPALQAFAAALSADVVQVGERLVAEVLTGGGPGDDLGGSSAPLSIEMYVYSDPDPEPPAPARGSAAVPAQTTGGVQ
jgi:hypothetical protein